MAFRINKSNNKFVDNDTDNISAYEYYTHKYGNKSGGLTDKQLKDFESKKPVVIPKKRTVKGGMSIKRSSNRPANEDGR